MESTAPRLEYDSHLGGHQSLPASLHVGNFVSARIKEMTALTEVIGTPSSAISEIRSFPKHMRRRAMSHNIKRIPKRLRNIHAALREKSNTREGSSKVPRRKFRRRPKELLKEYNRRQKNSVWLETHIWHAKRFKMVTKWNYRLALKPNDKSYRACYRATANHCLLQDISYYNCIELSGLETALLSGLSRHVSCETGLTFAAKATISGGREGSVMFYRADGYPQGAVGEINFIWKPWSKETPQSRTIWLWCHPGFHEELLKELITSFGLIKTQCHTDTMESSDSEVDEYSKLEMKKIELRNVPFERTPKYCNTEGVTLVVLKDTLNRFRLIGPLSQAILSHTLKPICIDKRRKEELQDWTQQYYLDQNCRLACEVQRNLWSSIEQFHSPAQLTPRCVVPLTIVDPRLSMPSFRKKALENSSPLPESTLEIIDTAHLDSPLWSHYVRDQVTRTKLSTERINEMRSHKIVPGLLVEQLDEKNEQQDLPCLPIMLIQRPGSQESSKRLGYGSGWDVITPCGFAMPLWLSFVLSGARVGGLREAEAFSREMGVHHVHSQADTAVGKAEENDKRINNTDRFFRLPPAKRLNYIKLNIPTPFYCCWPVLTKDWEGTEEFYVVRDIKLLNLLHLATKRSTDGEGLNVNNSVAGGLIPVRIDVRGRGTLDTNAHICLPKEGDLHTPPREPQKIDEFHVDRLKQRTAHQKLLRNLARKRHATRKAERDEQLDLSKDSKEDKSKTVENFASEKYVKEYAEKMRKLWLPSCSTIKDICSRQIIGFISSGDFCFTNGISSGVGYVTFKGLKEYLETRFSNKNFILVRNPNTDQYRLASINVIC